MALENQQGRLRFGAPGLGYVEVDAANLKWLGWGMARGPDLVERTLLSDLVEAREIIERMVMRALFMAPDVGDRAIAFLKKTRVPELDPVETAEAGLIKEARRLLLNAEAAFRGALAQPAPGQATLENLQREIAGFLNKTAMRDLGLGQVPPTPLALLARARREAVGLGEDLKAQIDQVLQSPPKP